MKKKIAILSMVLVTILCLTGFGLSTMAKDVEFNIEVDNAYVSKGEEFTILLTVTSEAKMKSIEAYLSYDNEAMEFVSCEGDRIKGASGKLQLQDSFANDAISKTYRIVMRALEVGSSELIVEESYMEKSNDFQILKTITKPAKINISENNKLSSEVRLEELLVFPESLKEAFSSDVYEYTANVESDINELIISAIPKDEKSSVALTGNGDFKTGDNLVTITVTAESGEEAVYKIKVIKK